MHQSKTDIFSLWDVTLFPLLMCAILFVLLWKYNRNRKKKPYYRFFFAGYILRVLSAMAYILIYKYYYGVGDVFTYFEGIKSLNDIAFSNPIRFMDIITSPFNNYYFSNAGLHPFLNTPDESLIVKIGGIFSLITGKSFLGIAMLFSLLHFIGVWKLYKLFSELYPSLYKHFAVAILFIPSVLFWGATMSKESVTMFAIGIATYSLFKYFILKKRKLKYLIGLIASLLALAIIKIYIIMSFVPAFLLLILLLRTRNIHSIFLRVTALPILLGLGFTILAIIFVFYGDALGKYSIDMVAQTAFTNYMYLARDGMGSAYDIGEFEPTMPSLISKFAPAVNVSLFRPYPWEARNPVMFLSVFESLSTLLFTLYVFLKVGLLNSFKQIFRNPIILFCLTLSIIFAFAVGLTSGNFGTLVRYKIPILPFYFIGIILLLYHKKIKNNVQETLS